MITSTITKIQPWNGTGNFALWRDRVVAYLNEQCKVKTEDSSSSNKDKSTSKEDTSFLKVYPDGTLNPNFYSFISSGASYFHILQLVKDTELQMALNAGASHNAISTFVNWMQNTPRKMQISFTLISINILDIKLEKLKIS